MRAEELRVGNYVSTIYPKFKYEKVNEIKEKVVYTDNIKGIGYISLKPIPLTEEILLKCGFEKGLCYFTYKHFDIDLKGWFGFNNMVANSNIKYLHQLQNLYFALTNKELEITL